MFEFDDKEVKDIMTHRKNIVSLDGSMSFIDAIEFIIDTANLAFRSMRMMLTVSSESYISRMLLHFLKKMRFTAAVSRT